MAATWRVTRVDDKIACVLYYRSGNVAHQSFVDIRDLDRLRPLFRRYLTIKDTESLFTAIRNA